MLCDKNFSPKLKGKFYRVVMRPTFWLVKKSFEQMDIEEMQMQRLICSYTRMEKIRGYPINGKVV